MVINSLQAGLVGERAGHLVLCFVLTYCSLVWIFGFSDRGCLFVEVAPYHAFFKDVYDTLVDV